MRLIDTSTLELVEFFGNNIPRYAILSHTWGDEEVTFKDWKRLNVARMKRGFFKIDMACKQAYAEGHGYLWVDTACIDKRSSSELSEAINSMFSWYRKAWICYAYLADVGPRPQGLSSKRMPKSFEQEFCHSRWFTRGWTLQELLAPRQMRFYARDWSAIADRRELAEEISGTTNIPRKYFLDGWTTLPRASVAQRMSWLSGRETTRIEDIAYCMLGIFDINMPLLYGEGSKAFTRLQEEIIRISTDHTIFCWDWTKSVPEGWTSLLAPCPEVFKDSGGYVRAQHNSFDSKSFVMTNAGLKISLPVLQAFSYQFGVLNATCLTDDQERSKDLACVPIQACLDSGDVETKGIMRRKPFPPRPLLICHLWPIFCLRLYIRSYPDLTFNTLAFLYRPMLRHLDHAFLVLFHEPHSLLGDGSRDFSERDHCDDVSTMLRSKERVEIEVFPNSKFDRMKSSIMLDRRSTADGALIRLRSHKGSSVIFLGAEFSPDNRIIRKFGGVIPRRSRMAQGRLEPSLLQTLLQHMLVANMKKGSWIKESSELVESSASGIGLDFGEEVKCDKGSLLPVLITYEEKSMALDNDSSDEGSETETQSRSEGPASRWQRNLEGTEDDIDFTSDAAFAWMVG